MLASFYVSLCVDPVIIHGLLRVYPGASIAYRVKVTVET